MNTCFLLRTYYVLHIILFEALLDMNKRIGIISMRGFLWHFCFLYGELKNIYFLLDILVCSIAEYFYKLCHVLMGEWKYQQWVKILFILHTKMTNKLFNIQLVHLICISYEVGKAKQIEKPSMPSRSVKYFKELDFNAKSVQSLPRLYHDFKCF